jgi:ArsR family transcriptional regulator
VSKSPKRILSLRALKACATERSLVVKAMAHPTRLLVMEALMQGEQCVNDLTAMAGCDVTTLSKHLSVMKKAGLLVCEKRSLNVYYQIACPCFADFFRCIDLISTTREAHRACAC